MEITSKTYAEVYEILNFLSNEEASKIPADVWENINVRKSEDCYKIDNLSNYTPSDEANFVLASLYKKYFATPEELRIIKAKERSIYIANEAKKREKYNPDDLFKKIKN